MNDYPDEVSRLNIRSIDFIKKKGSIDSLELKGKNKISRRKDKALEKPNDLKLSDLASDFNPKRPTAKALLGQREKEAITSVDAREIRQFISGNPGRSSSADMLKQLGNNDMSVSFGIPEGVEEDEFNQMELVFYSFRRRLAEAYIAAFFNKLNEFNLQNPHLQFPMTNEEEVMTGQVTYDANGNIVRIRVVRWTDKQKLQDFFVEVLEDLGTLPNPPDQMVHNGQFQVYYTLNIKK